MLRFLSDERKQLQAARNVLADVAELVQARFSVRLWDGSVVPLGNDVEPNFHVSISGPGVIGSILRWPTVENILRHYYATGQIDFHGGDLMAFVEIACLKNSRKRIKRLNTMSLLRNALPFFFAPAEKNDLEHEFRGDETGHMREQGENKDFIQFHYDIGNEFYQQFLDADMVYTCAYFTDWNNTLEQAQHDKLEMVCRKLQLQPGEKLLDMGCGWGALVCYAAQHYDVRAHGVTLSQAQVDFAQAKIRRLGLQDRVTVELRDFSEVEGVYDKVAAIGMIEHLGLANLPMYFDKVRSLLPDRGIFLNHGLTLPAKRSRRKFRKMRPEQRLIAKYIFPGGELDHLGHTIETMESHGFRVHDVEGWRDHYALTCKLWCQRLSKNRDRAIQVVGRERYRLWIAYLAGVSFALGDGSMCLFQTVATKHSAKGHSGIPPSRSHLYETREDSQRKSSSAA